ncbi:hypothetical protein LTR56_004535 [Elasticomyces elasticus]|nr:hypothetical protein LTR56_004535 [Elasticomyces elasticus]KAK3654267.1 hypothetical protein LTR22_010894 [Elasticomyces elasticus]KAK4919959.1 hypothetical protein LTR49_012396 [Elasticomyces elasticus]KAK5758793.1 hypothetical protein LTS12_011033 [Elasticomyces elasticus]
MAQPAEASDWPLKNSTSAAVVTGQHQIDDLNNNAHSTGPQRNDMNVQASKSRDRTMLRCVLGVTVLAFVSLILSIAITAHLHIGPGKYLLVAWITVSGGLLWLSSVPLFYLWLARRKATAAKPEDDAVEMRTLDGTSKHDTQNHPTAVSQPQASAPSLPEACFAETSGRMPGKDYKRPSKAFSTNNLNKTATTPIKAALITRAHDMPFEPHPNPLASSPILGGPSPGFPSPQTMYGSRYSRSVYANGSPTSKMTADSAAYDQGDPFRSSKMGGRSTSQTSLTMGYVQIARGHSVRRMNGASVRRPGMF